jgi:glycosyltransferase involved in cell wall biosynthesis
VTQLGLRKDIVRIGNGVDIARFFPESREEARRRLGIPSNAKVLVSVGGLCERKGFHRVIEVLPALREDFSPLTYLVIGGSSPEADWSDRLRAQTQELGLETVVRFLGPVEPDVLRWLLSASDVFVLATSNEGWANVFLEAMACGLPVVTTNVGGNAEVVTNADVGMLVKFGDPAELLSALAAALMRGWDHKVIRRWAEENSWTRRVETIVGELTALSACCARKEATV